MSEYKFLRITRVHLGDKAGARDIATVQDAADILMYAWPCEHGPAHRKAIKSCLRLMEGKGSKREAERAFREAAKEAGILCRKPPRGASKEARSGAP